MAGLWSLAYGTYYPSSCLNVLEQYPNFSAQLHSTNATQIQMPHIYYIFPEWLYGHTHTFTLLRGLTAVIVSVPVLFFLLMACTFSWILHMPGHWPPPPHTHLKCKGSVFIHLLSIVLVSLCALPNCRNRTKSWLLRYICDKTFNGKLGLTVIDLWRNSHVVGAVIVNAGIVF